MGVFSQSRLGLYALSGLMWASAPLCGAAVVIHTVDERTVTNHYAEIPAHAAFKFAYDVSLPESPPAGMTFRYHFVYINDRFVARLTPPQTAAGLNWRVNHPLSVARAVGESEILEVCIGDITNVADKHRQFCDRVILQTEVSTDSLEMHYVTTSQLNDGYSYSGCAAFGCGFYKDIFYHSDQPWKNDYRVSPDFPGPRGEPAAYHRNNLTFDFYYPGVGGKINSDPPKALIILSHPANKTKEVFRIENALGLEVLIDDDFAVAALDFRHPLKELDDSLVPVAKDDMARAVQFFKHYADVFNINQNKIVLMGTSLGGGLSVYSGLRELQDGASYDRVSHHSSRPAGVWAYDASTTYSPNWIRQNFLEAPIATTPAELNAYQCYYSYLNDDGNVQKFGHALGLVDASAPAMGLYYGDALADLSEYKLTVDDIIHCPDHGSPGTYDLVHLPNFALPMIQAYDDHQIGHKIEAKYSQPISQHYYDVVDFVNGL